MSWNYDDTTKTIRRKLDAYSLRSSELTAVQQMISCQRKQKEGLHRRSRKSPDSSWQAKQIITSIFWFFKVTIFVVSLICT